MSTRPFYCSLFVSGDGNIDIVRIKSLKLSIILQFVAIIAPFALVLLYQVLFDLRRIDAVRFEQGTAALAREARDNYKQFLNRVADAVDTGSLSGSALKPLAQVRQGLGELRVLELHHDGSAPEIDAALSKLSELLPQVRRDLAVDALRPHLPLIQNINVKLAVLAEEIEQRSIRGNRAFAKATERQVTLMLTTLGLTLAIAAFFILKLIKGLTRPLGYAIELAKNISEGNLQGPASIYPRGDLEGLLGSIDGMRIALQKLFLDLENKEVRLANAQRIAGIGDWEINLATGAVIWSKEFYAIVGYPISQAASPSGIPLEQVHPDERDMVEQALADARRFGTNIDMDFRMVVHSGAVRYVHVQSEVSMLDEVPVTITGTLQDVTYRKMSEEKLRYLAMHDGLTGLSNRLMFKGQLDRGIEIARRADGALAVLFLDLDHFKHINDSLGHHMGDELLKQVAHRIVATLRKSDFIYSEESNLLESVVSRLGGDEFTVLLSMVKSDQAAAQVAQRIIGDLNAPFLIAENQLFVSTSIGISMFPRDGDDGVSLLKNADSAMYFAKKEGRNNYQFFTESMNNKALSLLHMESDLHKALINGEFVLYYQPKVYIATRKIYGVEALIRWNHPEKGMISPSDFIPLAEARGLIVAIGEWVVNTACRQAAAWHQAGYGKLSVAINLAAPSFKSSSLSKVIAKAFAETGIDPKMLELEVTESVMMGGLDTVLPTLHTLKSLGLTLAIDDFGTGYSSLSYLGLFPLDTLKIDRSFVSNLDQVEGAAIVRAIIALSTSLKLGVIAEGVETEAEAEFLRAHGCERMQGFLFSRPVPAQAMTELLELHYLELSGLPLVIG
ncbi:EAL domain-containing protein [Massilia jejuensis]|uniref:EAL domain-containing protein n=1 Tax=Massilia jejuensis TaxID=648894 RepID=A0ABW0PME7_9BURK